MSEVRTRDTYHHGRLREALINAGVRLARDNGPEAVVLRARRSGDGYASSPLSAARTLRSTSFVR